MAEIEPSAQVIGGQPNLAKLLKPTKLHPKGRVKMNAQGEVDAPKATVIGHNEKTIKQKVDGMTVSLGTVQIPIYGGHVKCLNSVWRVGLNGPKKYHQKVLVDKELVKRKGATDDHTAPELTPEEFAEYEKYCKFLKEKKLEIAENEEFYAWLKGQE